MEINDKENGLIKRLTNKTFKFDKRFMDGYYSANYLLRLENRIRTFARPYSEDAILPKK